MMALLVIIMVGFQIQTVVSEVVLGNEVLDALEAGVVRTLIVMTDSGVVAEVIELTISGLSPTEGVGVMLIGL